MFLKSMQEHIIYLSFCLIMHNYVECQMGFIFCLEWFEERSAFRSHLKMADKIIIDIGSIRV